MDDGFSGITKLTYFAPNTVVDLISTVALEGISDIMSGYIASFSFGAVRHVFDGPDATDLDAEELDLGVGFHHQPGAIRR